MNEKEKQIIEKSGNKVSVSNFQYELLKKKYSRKWSIINNMRIIANIVTFCFIGLLIYKPGTIADSASVWTLLLTILWGGPATYAGVGKAKGED